MNDQEFYLPKFKNIERAIDDVRNFGIKTGREKVIGLHVDGHRLWDNEGDDQRVECPREFDGKCSEVLVIHCHPGLPTELSNGDIAVIETMGAWGNLAAACDDETISWSRGFRVKNELLQEWVFFPEFEHIQKVTLHVMATLERIKNQEEYDNWFKSWSDKDNRYVALQHATNAVALHNNLYSEYHVRLGDRAKNILGKYPEFMNKLEDYLHEEAETA